MPRILGRSAAPDRAGAAAANAAKMTIASNLFMEILDSKTYQSCTPGQGGRAILKSFYVWETFLALPAATERWPRTSKQVAHTFGHGAGRSTMTTFTLSRLWERGGPAKRVSRSLISGDSQRAGWRRAQPPGGPSCHFVRHIMA